GFVYVLEQVRVVRIAAHAGEEVFAQIGGAQTTVEHDLDHRRVDVPNLLEQRLRRARHRPPDVLQPPTLAHALWRILPGEAKRGPSAATTGPRGARSAPPNP